MECPLVLLAFLALPLLFSSGLKTMFRVLATAKSCALTSRFSEKCSVPPDARAPNLRPQTHYGSVVEVRSVSIEEAMVLGAALGTWK
uniref:Putative secreted protein n=1 Tax=Ixodes ricinus TaxID=34613 RepID=A0A147BPW9_IXORI